MSGLEWLLAQFVHWGCFSAPEWQLWTVLYILIVVLMLMTISLFPNRRRLTVRGRHTKRWHPNDHRKKHARDTSNRWNRKHLLNRDGNICALCIEPILHMKDATIDHIIPLSRGGADTLENMQITHSKCNRQKGNRFQERNEQLIQQQMREITI